MCSLLTKFYISKYLYYFTKVNHLSARSYQVIYCSVKQRKSPHRICDRLWAIIPELLQFGGVSWFETVARISSFQSNVSETKIS